MSHKASFTSSRLFVPLLALLLHSRLTHPGLSKFQKLVPHFSSLYSLEFELFQLRKHTIVSFLKRLDPRKKSPFELVHTDFLGPSRFASILGFRYFVTVKDLSPNPFRIILLLSLVSYL